MLTELGEISFVFIPMAQNQRAVDCCRGSDASRRCSSREVHSSAPERARSDTVHRCSMSRHGEITSISTLPTYSWCSRSSVITVDLREGRKANSDVRTERRSFTFQHFAERFLVGRKRAQSQLIVHRWVIAFTCLDYQMFQAHVVQHVGFPVRSIEAATTFMRLVQRSVSKICRMRWRNLASGIGVVVDSCDDLLVGKRIQLMVIGIALVTGWFFSLKRESFQSSRGSRFPYDWRTARVFGRFGRKMLMERWMSA